MADLFIYATICIIFLILHGCILFVLFYRRKDFKSSYYTIITFLTISDLSIIAYNLYRGIRSKIISYTLETRHDILSKMIIFTNLSSGWYPSLFFNVLVALNRYVAIRYYSEYKIRMSLFRTKILILIAYLICALLISPVFLTKSDIKTCKVAILTRQKLDCDIFSRIFFISNVIFTLFVLFSIISLYFAAIIYSIICIRKRKKCPNRMITAGSNTNFNYFNLREQKLLAQGVVLGLTLIVAELVFWFNSEKKKMLTAYRLFFVVYAGLQAVIYLIFDEFLRRKVFDTLIFCRKRNQAPSERTATERSHLSRRSLKDSTAV